MIRILQVLGSLNVGGAESRIMDLYRLMDKSNIQFDFLVTESTQEYFFEKEIREMGGKIFYLPRFKIINYFEYKRRVKDFFGHNNNYEAVHGHMTSTAAIYLPIAKKYGVPMTIAHARSAGVDPGIKGVVTKWLRRNLYRKCDLALACSKEAGNAVFGSRVNVKILPNAINTDDCKFNRELRSALRTELAILPEQMVIGHVGSFRYAKNHEFILKVFAEILKRRDALLILLGDGELRKKIEAMAQELMLMDNIRFMGNINPVSKYYNIFDCLLFPSRYEGMPGTVVEAQANSLECIVSTSVTPEVKATDLVQFVSLDESPEVWAEACILAGERRHDNKIENVNDLMNNSMFNAKKQVEYYSKLYASGIN